MSAILKSSTGARHAIGQREFVVLMAAMMSLNALAIDGMLPALDEIAQALVVPDPNGGVTVYDSQAKATQVAKDEIEEIAPNKISSMPTGLLNELTQQEIADLFAYLNHPPQVDVARRPEE